MLFEQSRTITAGIIKLPLGGNSRCREGVVDRERVGRIRRDSVGDFAISKGSKMSLREPDVTPASYGYRAKLSGVQWFREGVGRVRGGQTGRHVSLRVIKVGPRYGGSCTAPVATKAPHHGPSLSPLTLSPSPCFLAPVFPAISTLLDRHFALQVLSIRHNSNLLMQCPLDTALCKNEDDRWETFTPKKLYANIVQIILHELIS